MDSLKSYTLVFSCAFQNQNWWTRTLHPGIQHPFHHSSPIMSKRGNQMKLTVLWKQTPSKQPRSADSAEQSQAETGDVHTKSTSNGGVPSTSAPRKLLSAKIPPVCPPPSYQVWTTIRRRPRLHHDQLSIYLLKPVKRSPTRTLATSFKNGST